MIQVINDTQYILFEYDYVGQAYNDFKTQAETEDWIVTYVEIIYPQNRKDDIIMRTKTLIPVSELLKEKI